MKNQSTKYSTIRMNKMKNSRQKNHKTDKEYKLKEVWHMSLAKIMDWPLILV